MANVYRNAPLSIAVSMALLAAAATSAMATRSADRDRRTDDTSPDARSQVRGMTDDLEEVIVTGVRQSQIRAIEVKRDWRRASRTASRPKASANCPTRRITDALQRITGVQINRDAGVGTSVSVRGLPQVGTLLNGEVFISPDQIDSQQPDFTTLPATLFNQVDVIKSPTAAQTETGISGVAQSAHLSALGFAAWVHL